MRVLFGHPKQNDEALLFSMLIPKSYAAYHYLNHLVLNEPNDSLLTFCPQELFSIGEWVQFQDGFFIYQFRKL